MKRIYTSICLFPFIFILAISILNLSKPHKITILTWNSPKLSIGYFTSIASSIGFLYGILTISSLNKSPNNIRRKVIVKSNSKPNEELEDTSYNDYNEKEDLSTFYENDQFIQRDPREPLPTLTVPYRVIRNKERFTEKDEIEHYKDSEITNTDTKETEINYYDTPNLSTQIKEGEWGDTKSLEDW